MPIILAEHKTESERFKVSRQSFKGSKICEKVICEMLLMVYKVKSNKLIFDLYCLFFSLLILKYEMTCDLYLMQV